MKVLGWKFAGEVPHNDIVQGIIPSSGMTFLVAPNEDERRAIVADLAVAVAGGNVGAVVPDGKKPGDGWRLDSGFLRIATCDACGVAIIGACGDGDIKAAMAWRGVKANPPIAVSTAPKNDIVSARLHDLRHEINVGLVIVAADWSRGVDEIKRVLNYLGDFAALVVSATEPPATMIRDGSRVLRVADGSLTLSHPATATPWARSFTLEPVRMTSGQAHGVRSTGDAASVPQFAPVAPDAPQPREAYAGHVVCWRSVFGLHPSEPSRWPEGAHFEEQPFEAARAASEIDGRVQIIVALGPESKLDPKEERRRVRTACEQFKISDRVDVGLAARTLLDARDVKGSIAPAA